MSRLFYEKHKECSEKVDGICPHSNVVCSFPDCEKKTLTLAEIAEIAAITFGIIIGVLFALLFTLLIYKGNANAVKAKEEGVTAIEVIRKDYRKDTLFTAYYLTDNRLRKFITIKEDYRTLDTISSYRFIKVKQ